MAMPVSLFDFRLSFSNATFDLHSWFIMTMTSNMTARDERCEMKDAVSFLDFINLMKLFFSSMTPWFKIWFMHYCM